MKRLKREAESAKSNPREVYGYTSYGHELGEWPILNRITGGIHKKKYQLLYSRMKVGKSMLAASWIPLVAHDCPDGQVVRVVTLEMSAEAYIRRMAAVMAKVANPQSIQQGMWSSDDHYDQYLAALDTIAEMPLEFWDQPIDLIELEDFIGNPDVPTFWWVLDHVGLISMPLIGGRSGAPDHVTTSRTIMRICHSYATGLIIGHANRATGSGIPALESIALSDQYGRDMDEAFALARPFKSQLPDDEDEEGGDEGNVQGEPAVLRITMRDGAGGDLMLWWSRKYAHFVEVPEDMVHLVETKIQSAEKARLKK